MRMELCIGLLCLLPFSGLAEDLPEKSNEKSEEIVDKTSKKNRLIFGGYGEAVVTRNFFSDNYLRYTDAEKYKNGKSHGRFDIPHVVFYIGYDFGKGWSMGSEIEFEHGGVETAIEVEEEEGGEYEKEVEKGGEVALEQFWIQKSFSSRLNLRMGHIIVPVGATNQHHMPTEFFTAYRPEGENTIMPCTWHETGISVWGRTKNWRYELMLIPGLDSDRFGRTNWIGSSSGSPYEFKIGNALAGAFRVDNYSIEGLRLSASGYIGNTFSNTLSVNENTKYKDVKGTLAIGSFDFGYNAHNFVVRGNFDWGHLDDSKLITQYNMSMRKDSPSPKQAVASDAVSTGIECGYNLFSQFKALKEADQKLYIFGRYEYYDSMAKTESGITDYEWCGRQRIAAGLNYFPIKDIVIKGEYSIGLLKKQYNNEPSISFAVAYSGFFTR